MSQQFLKNLECFCVKGLEQTCPAGGFLDATLTLDKGAWTADIVSDGSNLSSPGKELSCVSTDVVVTGGGPFYEVEIVSSTENIVDACDFVDVGWTLTVTRVNEVGTQFEYYDVKSRSVDGKILVFGLSDFILESGVTFTFEGVGLITRPTLIRARQFDGLLEATSEISSQLGANLSIKPDEQLLEKGTKYDFMLEANATNLGDGILKVMPHSWVNGDDPNYVYHLIRRNDKDATITLLELGGLTEAIIFSGSFVDFVEGGFTVDAGVELSSEILDNILSGFRFKISIDDQFANTVMNEGDILPDLTADYSIKDHVIGTSTLEPGFTDKIVGDFGLFRCEQKLFPSGDRVIQDGFGSFLGPTKQTENLFTFIDEGVFDGRMLDKEPNVSTLSDNKESFITPDSIHTEGLFQYKCNLTDFTVRPDHTRLHMRIAAPISNYESRIAPVYTVHNIKFLDPSGNLIIKYKDFSLRGDA